jgi:hypothetical protein
VVESVGQSRRYAVVVLGRNYHKGVCTPKESCQTLQDLRGFAFQVFLVHPIEQRKLQLDRIDKRRFISPKLKMPGDETCGPVAPDGQIEPNPE